MSFTLVAQNINFIIIMFFKRVHPMLAGWIRVTKLHLNSLLPTGKIEPLYLAHVANLHYAILVRMKLRYLTYFLHSSLSDNVKKSILMLVSVFGG